jgi:hypothetical protein
MAGPHRWIATTPSSWVAGSFDTNLLPGNNEKVIFDGTGQGDVVGGLDQSAVDLDLLQVDAGYEGNIGADGGPLIISADEVIYQGLGTLAYKDGNGITDLMIVDSANLQDAVKLSGATITRLRCRMGHTALLGDFTGTIAKLELAPRLANSQVVVDVGMTFGGDVTDMWMQGGTLQGRSPFVGLNAHKILISGGLWDISNGAAGDYFVLDGGTVRWSVPTQSPGVSLAWSGEMHLLSGTLDARAGGSKAITNLYLWETASFFYTNGKMSVSNTHRMEP